MESPRILRLQNIKAIWATFMEKPGLLVSQVEDS